MQYQSEIVKPKVLTTSFVSVLILLESEAALQANETFEFVLFEEGKR